MEFLLVASTMSVFSIACTGKSSSKSGVVALLALKLLDLVVARNVL